MPENNHEEVKAELVGLVERLAEKEPQIAGELLALLTRAGFLQNLLAHPATPSQTQAAPAALPDPPPAPFDYTDEEIYDRQERAARFRGQRRPIEHEGSPWAG